MLPSMLREKGIHELELAVEALNAPEEVRAPKLAFAGFITKRFERNRNLDDVTVFIDCALRFEQQVHTEVFAATFSENSVSLDSERIKKYFKCPPLVVKSVEIETDVVVLENVVALGHRRTNLVWLIKARKAM